MRNDMPLRRVVILLLPLLLSAALTGCGHGPDAARSDTGFSSLPPALQQNVLAFLQANASPAGPASLIVCRAADVNNDGLPDIILLFIPAAQTRPVEAHDGNVMCVLVSSGAGFSATNCLPAPFERQTIQLKDIDGKPPLEFIVMGSKGAKTGLGVYRVVGNIVENLFGESMDECC